MKKILASLLLALAVGCTTVQGPLTFEGRIDYALAQNTAARKVCSDLVNRGRMTADEGQQCLDFTNEVRAAIDAAKAMGGAADADQLRAVQQALLMVESFLQERAK